MDIDFIDKYSSNTSYNINSDDTDNSFNNMNNNNQENPITGLSNKRYIDSIV